MRAHLFKIVGENDSKGYFLDKFALFMFRSVDDFKTWLACLTHALGPTGTSFRLGRFPLQ